MFNKVSANKILRVFLTFFPVFVVIVSFIAMNVSAAGQLIQNDVFKKDTSGNPIYSQGGGIFKFGNTYYWYGVKYNGAVTYYNNPSAGKSSDTSFNAVTCYTSTDLVNWTFAGNILTASTPGLQGAGWLGRGGVAYCPSSGKYVWMSQIYINGNDGELFCTSSTPTGPFTFNNIQYPVPGVANNATGDQTVFTDTDGKSYICASSKSGRSNVYICSLRASDYCAVTGSTRIFGGVGREGNCMFKYNGRYYVCSSDLHGWNASHCYVIDSTNIMGPYGSEYIMQGTANTYCHVSQTGFFYTITGTSGSFVLFAGDRWSDFAGNGLGYNVWVPISFNGATPIFNDCSQWNLDSAAGTWSIAAGNNYVHNAEFEADRIVVSQPIGWTCSGTGNTNVSGKRYSGNFYWQQKSSSTYTATLKQTITGLPNGTYTLKAWVQSSGGQSQCYLYASNYGGSQLNSNLNTAIGSWTERTVSSAINVTNGQCEIGLYSSASANQWVNVDEVSLVRTGGGSSPTPTPTPTQRPTITATPTPTSPRPTPTPGGSVTYQAENASYGGGTVLETTNGGYDGTGYVNFPSSGGYLQFDNVDGGAGGAKTLKFRNALGATGSRTGRIQINGGAWQNITFSPTGSWTTWTILSVSATLNSGAVNTIRLESTGQDLANIDELGI